jgi:hypothetical protein
MSVEIISNVFTQDQIQTLFHYVFQPEHQASWMIQKHSWDPNIVSYSLGVVAIFPFRDEMYSKIANDLKRFLRPGETFGSIQYYEWNQLSQINWHPDDYGEKVGAITIYLNDVWFDDWGGMFCWYPTPESKVGQFRLPVFNSGVIARGGIPHHVTPVNPFALVRKTLQVWIIKEINH